jgi:hypothetical protein
MSLLGEHQYVQYPTRKFATKTYQMAIPFFQFMLKEITTKCVLAYTDKDFKETVDAFLAGKLSMQGQITVTNVGFRRIREHREHGN